MTLHADVLGHRQRRDAQTVAARFAEALAVPAVPRRRDDASGPTSAKWRGQSLSKGAAGVAVLHGARAHAGHGSWERVHQWLACATREDLSAGPNAGLWHGAPAVAFALSTAAPPGRYPRLREQLDIAVTTMVRRPAGRGRRPDGCRPAAIAGRVRPGPWSGRPRRVPAAP